MVSQTPNGNGIPRARQPTQPPSKTQDAQNGSARDSAIDIAEEEDPYTLVDSDEDDDEDPYTLPDPVEATAQQNATPTYENLPLNPEANLPTTGERRFISRAILIIVTTSIVALTTWKPHLHKPFLVHTNPFLMHTNPFLMQLGTEQKELPLLARIQTLVTVGSQTVEHTSKDSLLVQLSMHLIKGNSWVWVSTQVH